MNDPRHASNGSSQPSPAEARAGGDPDDPADIGRGSAPAKIILAGEHAVVYGQPAIALPVPRFRAEARVYELDEGPTRIRASFPAGEARAELDLELGGAEDEEALGAAVRAALRYAGRTERTPWRIELESSVPTGRGLGSSAAVSVAVVRAIGGAAEQDWDDETVADLAMAGERQAHGRPSGIDPTVVAFGRPIRFQAGRGQPLEVGRPLRFLVADSGRPAATAEMVDRVARQREERPGVYADWMKRIAELVDDAVTAIARGNPSRLGRLMDRNHLLLQGMRVSGPELDGLVAAARGAGALGAKLSGSGGGGAVICLVDADREAEVQAALIGAGARDCFGIELPASED